MLDEKDGDSDVVLDDCMAVGRDHIVVSLGSAYLGVFDLAAGRLRRAPKVIQRLGLEMPYRIVQEPRRLFGRYSRNALFMFKMLAKDLGSGIASKGRRLIGASGADRGKGTAK